jgi:hypothetical protein
VSVKSAAVSVARLIGSLKMTSTEPTAVLRGSGDTSTTSVTVGAVVSTCQVSEPDPTPAFPPVSWTPVIVRVNV